MPRGLLLLAVFIPWLVAARADAHAVVIKASLDDAPVHANTPTQVTLQFNSRIEPGFTRVTLLGATEEPLAVEAGPDAGRVTVALPGLAAGAYALRYKVLAVDGHVTESTLRFRVTGAE
jgi:methionine-rich copper-binding protein CopC